MLKYSSDESIPATRVLERREYSSDGQRSWRGCYGARRPGYFGSGPYFAVRVISPKWYAKPRFKLV